MSLELCNYIIKGKLKELQDFLASNPDFDINQVFEIPEKKIPEKKERANFGYSWDKNDIEEFPEFHTLLTAAIEAEQSDIEDFLLAHPDIELHKAFKHTETEEREYFATPLQFAIKHNKIQSIKKMLPKYQANLETSYVINLKKDHTCKHYRTALMYAIACNTPEALTLIINAGADVEKNRLNRKISGKNKKNKSSYKNKIYRTPISYAVEAGLSEIVEILIAQGASTTDETLATHQLLDGQKINKNALQTPVLLYSRFYRKAIVSTLSALLSAYPTINNYARIKPELFLESQIGEIDIFNEEYQHIIGFFVDYPFLFMAMAASKDEPFIDSILLFIQRMSPIFMMKSFPPEMQERISFLVTESTVEPKMKGLLQPEQLSRLKNGLFTSTRAYSNSLVLNVLVTKILTDYVNNIDISDKKFTRLITQEGRDEARQRIYRAISYIVKNELIDDEKYDTAKNREEYTDDVVNKLIDTELTIDHIFEACVDRAITKQEFSDISSSKVVIRDYEHRWESFKPHQAPQYHLMSEKKQIQLFVENTLIKYGLTLEVSSKGFKTLFLPPHNHREQESRKDAIQQAITKVLQDSNVSWSALDIAQQQQIGAAMAKVKSFTKNHLIDAIKPLVNNQPTSACLGMR